jgi:hypothetical protein
MEPPSIGIVAGDGLEQRGFARAVAPDQADAAAGVDGEVGVVQQEAAGDADGYATDDQELMRGGLPAVWFAGEGLSSEEPCSKAPRHIHT